jgi:tyrosyl-tRNA synthetase
MPLLIGLDGQKKMSKTSLNYIALNDSPEDMFGKTMSISDEMILDYYTLCVSASAELLKEVADKLSQREEFNPRDIKVELAMRIVETYYSKEEAARAKEHFENLFKKKLVPDDIPECNLFELKDYDLDTGIPLVDLMVLKELAETKGEAKRLIQGGGVKLNGEKISDVFLKLTLEYLKSISDSTENPDTTAAILQVGKKKFCKLVTNLPIKA